MTTMTTTSCRKFCAEPPTLRISSPYLDEPLDRCIEHVGDAVEVELWALAELGHEKPSVTVTAITNGS